MSGLTEFLHMGGYASYVWSAYALTAICLVFILVWSSRQYKKALQQAVRRSQQNAKRKAGKEVMQ